MSSSIYYTLELKDEIALNDIYRNVIKNTGNLNCYFRMDEKKILMQLKDGVSETLIFEIKDHVINGAMKWWNDEDPEEYYRLLDLFIDLKPLCNKLEIEDEEDVWNEYQRTQIKPVLEKKPKVSMRKIFANTFDDLMYANGFTRKNMSYFRIYGDNILQIARMFRKPGYYEFYVQMVPLYQTFDEIFFKELYLGDYPPYDFKYIMNQYKNWGINISVDSYFNLFKDYGLPILNRTKTAVDLYDELKALENGYYKEGNIDRIPSWRIVAMDVIKSTWHNLTDSNMLNHLYPNNQSQMVACVKCQLYDEAIFFLKEHMLNDDYINNYEEMLKKENCSQKIYQEEMKSLIYKREVYQKLYESINNHNYNEIDNILNDCLQNALQSLYKYYPKIKHIH